MKLFKRLKRLGSDKKGNVLVLSAAAMPLIIGSAGLAIDTIQLSLLKRHLQRAADSAALAGAYAKAQGKDASGAVTYALTYSNAFPATPAVTQPTTGTHANRAVQVNLTAGRSLPFMSFFTSGGHSITVSATAALVYSGKYCMIALDESTTAPGIIFAGSSTVNMNCGGISNGSAENAVEVNGNATSITASPMAAVGGVPFSSRYQQPTLLLPYSLKQEDPFANLPTPPSFSSCGAKIVDDTDMSTVTPGTCYDGVDFNNAKTFSAGTYYIAGDFKINANASLTANQGVTFVFVPKPGSSPPSWPKVEIDGSAMLDLKAPTSGTYEGVIMHYPKEGPTLGSGVKIEGNSASKFEGAFYFPKQDVTFRGNSSMVTNCIQIVARRLTFEGNTVINNSCPTGGGARAFDATWVRLVK